MTNIKYPATHTTININRTKILYLNENLNTNGINNKIPNNANKAVEKVSTSENILITIIKNHFLLENEERE